MPVWVFEPLVSIILFWFNVDGDGASLFLAFSLGLRFCLWITTLRRFVCLRLLLLGFEFVLLRLLGTFLQFGFFTCLSDSGAALGMTVNAIVAKRTFPHFMELANGWVPEITVGLRALPDAFLFPGFAPFSTKGSVLLA